MFNSAPFHDDFRNEYTSWFQLSDFIMLWQMNERSVAHVFSSMKVTLNKVISVFDLLHKIDTLYLAN